MDRFEQFRKNLTEEQKLFLRQVQAIFNLDEIKVLEVFEEMLSRHEDLLSNLSIDKKGDVGYAGAILFLPFKEAYIRGQINYVASSALSKNEILPRLKPFHQEILSMLENTLKPSQELAHPILLPFLLRERERYLLLLEELKKLIRDSGASEGSTINGSDLEQTENSVEEKLMLGSNSGSLGKVVPQIFVKETFRHTVYECLKKFVPVTQHQPLVNLLENGENSAEGIYFNGRQNLLVDLFARLFQNDKLEGAGSNKEVAYWLSINFRYSHGQKLKNVSFSAAENLISRRINVPTEGKRLCYIAGLK